MDVTRFTAVAFTPDPNTSNNGFFTPQLNQTEINNIPANADQVGGILFNESTEELQYLAPTLQWVNVATDGGEPTFSEVNVTTDLTVGGNIIGKIPKGYFNTITTPSFDLTANVAIKLPNTTIFTPPPGFAFSSDGQSNRIKYTPPAGYPNNASVLVLASVNMLTIGANGDYTVSVAKNQVVGTIDQYQVRTCATSNLTAFNISYQTILATNDYLELWIKCSADSTGNSCFCNMSVILM